MQSGDQFAFTAEITKAFRFSEIRKSEWREWDERHGRQCPRVAVECGGAEIQIIHPIQEQGRPVPNRRLRITRMLLEDTLRQYNLNVKNDEHCRNRSRERGQNPRTS